MSDTDEFGLPKRILLESREVTGEHQQSHQFDVILADHAPEVDKVRIVFRQGVEFILEEMWDTGIVTISIRTQKGQAPFATFNPNKTGFDAMRVAAPVQIL